MRFLPDHVSENALLWYVAIIVTLIAVAQFALGTCLHSWLYGG